MFDVLFVSYNKYGRHLDILFYNAKSTAFRPLELIIFYCFSIKYSTASQLSFWAANIKAVLCSKSIKLYSYYNASKAATEFHLAAYINAVSPF